MANSRGMPLLATLALLPLVAAGRGVSPYLPLDLEPEIESRIERVLLLADKPVLTRPIAAAIVLDALPEACRKDEALCREVGRYLNRYKHRSGLSHASLEAIGSGGDPRTVPNRRGLDNDSPWLASVQAYLQPSDYVLLGLGGVAYEGESMPTGTLLSVGTSRAQLDVGYRDHWWSPLTDSSFLVSSEAPTMPSVTLSNYEPLTRLGLRYEAFLARMSESDRIALRDGFTSGNPRLAGLHLSIEPVSGWALGLNRVLQFGGGARSASAGDFLEAFFSPGRFDNAAPDLDRDEEFGNQVASITSRFLFPGRMPFAVYAEYAGEDTSSGKNLLLGNAALSLGIQLPRLWRGVDLAYEVSEWQNAWYVNSIYLDGLVTDGHVLGHWGGDQRVAGDAVGGQSHMLRLGWTPAAGGSLDVRYRTIENEAYSPVSYQRGHEIGLRYARPLGLLVVGADLQAGRDVFGEDFSRFGLFVRYAANGEGRGAFLESARPTASETGAELFVEAGANAHDVSIDLDATLPETSTGVQLAPHFALGARRAVGARSDLGVRLELDDIDGNLLIGVRALDYRYRFPGPLALGAFLGAARYDLATPAFGVYGGVGVQWRELLRGWDLGLDLRYALKVARDDLVASDPIGDRPDSFYDIRSAALYLSRRF